MGGTKDGRRNASDPDRKDRRQTLRNQPVRMNKVEFLPAEHEYKADQLSAKKEGHQAIAPGLSPQIGENSSSPLFAAVGQHLAFLPKVPEAMNRQPVELFLRFCTRRMR